MCWLKFCLILTVSKVHICFLLRYYHVTPRNMPEGRRSLLYRGESLQSRIAANVVLRRDKHEHLVVDIILNKFTHYHTTRCAL